MPKLKPKKSPRRGKQLSPLPRQKEQKPLFPPSQLGRARVLDQLHDVISCCQEQFDEHGAGCACETCCVVSNMVGSLRLFRMVLEIS